MLLSTSSSVLRRCFGNEVAIFSGLAGAVPREAYFEFFMRFILNRIRLLLSATNLYFVCWKHATVKFSIDILFCFWGGLAVRSADQLCNHVEVYQGLHFVLRSHSRLLNERTVSMKGRLRQLREMERFGGSFGKTTADLLLAWKTGRVNEVLAF